MGAQFSGGDRNAVSTATPTAIGSSRGSGAGKENCLNGGRRGKGMGEHVCAHFYVLCTGLHSLSCFQEEQTGIPFRQTRILGDQ